LLYCADRKAYYSRMCSVFAIQISSITYSLVHSKCYFVDHLSDGFQTKYFSEVFPFLAFSDILRVVRLYSFRCCLD